MKFLIGLFLVMITIPFSHAALSECSLTYNQFSYSVSTGEKTYRKADLFEALTKLFDLVNSRKCLFPSKKICAFSKHGSEIILTMNGDKKGVFRTWDDIVFVIDNLALNDICRLDSIGALCELKDDVYETNFIRKKEVIATYPIEEKSHKSGDFSFLEWKGYCTKKTSKSNLKKQEIEARQRGIRLLHERTR